MVAEYNQFIVNGNNLTIEIVREIPSGFQCIDTQNGYDVFLKSESIGSDIYNYFCAKRAKANIADKMKWMPWVAQYHKRTKAL